MMPDFINEFFILAMSNTSSVIWFNKLDLTGFTNQLVHIDRTVSDICNPHLAQITPLNFAFSTERVCFLSFGLGSNTNGRCITKIKYELLYEGRNACVYVSSFKSN